MSKLCECTPPPDHSRHYSRRLSSPTRLNMEWYPSSSAWSSKRHSPVTLLLHLMISEFDTIQCSPMDWGPGMMVATYRQADNHPWTRRKMPVTVDPYDRVHHPKNGNVLPRQILVKNDNGTYLLPTICDVAVSICFFHPRHHNLFKYLWNWRLVIRRKMLWPR